MERLWRRLQRLSISHMPLAVPPPRDSRFGSPLVLSRVHWVRPELVAEVKYPTSTGDILLRQLVYKGLREDKPAAEVRREAQHPVHRRVAGRMAFRTAPSQRVAQVQACSRHTLTTYWFASVLRASHRIHECPAQCRVGYRSAPRSYDCGGCPVTSIPTAIGSVDEEFVPDSPLEGDGFELVVPR
jgi:hypothetical protein